MERRGFLKLLSAAAASSALPVPSFVLAEPQIVIPEFPIELGKIRAMCGYSIEQDLNFVRLDALNGKTRKQFYVDFKVQGHSDAEVREDYLRVIVPASHILREAILHEKWMASDMIALPLPVGYDIPKWMQA